MQQSYPRTPAVRKSWVVRQFIKLIVFTGLMGFIIEQVGANSSVGTSVPYSAFCFRIFLLDAKIFHMYVYNAAVYQSNCSELSTPFEGEPFIRHRESFEAFSSKFIRVALHVLLLFSPLVYLQLLFLDNTIFFSYVL